MKFTAELPIIQRIGEYDIIKDLGQGSFGKVFHGRKDQNDFALKLQLIDTFQPIELRQIIQEIEILRRLNHPNLIKFIEFLKEFRFVNKHGQLRIACVIVLELACGGELYYQIENYGPLDSDIARYYFIQLLNGLLHMKSLSLYHGDLKMDNILLDQNYNIKICDFGFSANLDQGNITNFRGTKGYKAPEIENHQPYNGTKADVFALGVVLFIIYIGLFPFEEAIQQDRFFRLLTNSQDKFWNSHENWAKPKNISFPADLRNLIGGMLCEDPNQRFSLQQCLEHRWTQQPIPTHNEVLHRMRSRGDQQQNKQIQQQQQQQQQQVVGKYEGRSSNNNDQIDFSIIENQYHITNNSRKIIVYPEGGMLNEIYSFRDPYFILCYLLKECSQFNSKVNKLYEGKFKILFNVIEDGEDVGKIKLELNKIQCENNQNKIRIEIKNKGVDYFIFHRVIHLIKVLIQSI